MAKKQKLTPWFPAYTKPARPGAYEVGFLHMGEVSPYAYPFHYFDGVDWVNDASKTPTVMRGRYLPLTHYGNAFWRGLAEQPK